MSSYGEATVVRTNGVLAEGVWEPHDGGGILTLDTAGEYRYRMTRRRDPDNPECYVFERMPS